MTKNGAFDRECRVLKALAHPTRLAIVDELLRQEKCVSAIENRLKARQANISQHLSILRWASIVDCRTDGKVRCYYLRDPKAMAVFRRALRQCKPD